MTHGPEVPTVTTSATHWMTRDGSLVSFAEMRDGHLANCERMLRAKGAPEENPAYATILTEMRARGLELLPLGKPEDQQVRDAVTSLHALWPHLDEDQKVHLVRTQLRGFFKRTVGAGEIADACEVWRP